LKRQPVGDEDQTFSCNIIHKPFVVNTATRWTES
jgi:hypothetical protein